jgi:hypothetical protein
MAALAGPPDRPDYDCRLLNQITAEVIVTTMSTNITKDRRRKSG